MADSMAIYAIAHINSGRVYVGSSASVAKRWRYHRFALRRRFHENSRLQECWDNDGPGSLEFRVLEYVDDPNELIPREQHWIDTLCAATVATGLNMVPNAGTLRGRRLSEEHRRKLSVASKGHPVSAEQRAKIAAKAMGNHRGIDNLTRFRETRMLPIATVREVRLALAAGQRRADVMAAFALPGYTMDRITSYRCYPDILPELRQTIRIARPEWRRGEISAQAKLTEAIVRDIMARLAKHESMVSIARDYGVTPGAISQIKHGRAWTHVTQQPVPLSK